MEECNLGECNSCKRADKCTLNDIVFCSLLGYVYFKPKDAHMYSGRSSERKKLIGLLKGHNLDTENDIAYVADLLLRNGVKVECAENADT